VRKSTVTVLVILLVFILAGCNMPSDTPDLSTLVAATLAALDAGSPGGSPAGSTPEMTVEPGVVPTSPPSTAVLGLGVLSIAYINGGEVWFVEEGGTPIQLTSSGDVENVVLSTDGQLAVFVRHVFSPELFELRVVGITSMTESLLISQPDFDGLYPLGGALHHAPYQVEFIPGTHTLLMNTREIYEGPGLAQNNELWSIDADTGIRTLLLDRGLGGDFFISPGADRLALVLPTSIGFANIDGTGRSPEHLTFPSVITYSEYGYYPIPVWSSDGSAIDVVIPGEDPFVDFTARVWQVPVSGAAVPLLDLTGFGYFRNSGKSPMLAPDLSKVAFLRETAPNIFDLIVAPLDGSPESVYATGDLAWQGWNPDSTQFVFTNEPLNLMLGSVGLPPLGVGFGSWLRWVDADTFLYLDQLTAIHRFGLVNLPSPASELDVIAGSLFDYDFTR